MRRHQSEVVGRQRTAEGPQAKWAGLVAHLVRDEGVAGSNPATPTSFLVAPIRLRGQLCGTKHASDNLAPPIPIHSAPSGGGAGVSIWKRCQMSIANCSEWRTSDVGWPGKLVIYDCFFIAVDRSRRQRRHRTNNEGGAAEKVAGQVGVGVEGESGGGLADPEMKARFPDQPGDDPSSRAFRAVIQRPRSRRRSARSKTWFGKAR
jgi:hypothetical protein